jgi:hypothetical protein
MVLGVQTGANALSLCPVRYVFQGVGSRCSIESHRSRLILIRMFSGLSIP